MEIQRIVSASEVELHEKVKKVYILEAELMALKKKIENPNREFDEKRNEIKNSKQRMMHF